MNCTCGHSEAAHHRTPTGECAFCLCRSFMTDGEEDNHDKKEPPDELVVALELLGRHPAFESIAPELLDGLAQRGRRRTILRDAVLMDKGDASDRLFLILRGEVAVDRDARGALPELHATLGPGEVVGEVGLLHGALHSATVVALDDVHVLELTQADMRELFREHHELRLAFMRMVHHRMQPPA